MSGVTSLLDLDATGPDNRRAHMNFARLMSHVAGLYCMGESSTVSAHEAHELTLSVAYTLGIADATADEATAVLDVDDIIALWQSGLASLDARVNDALGMRNKIIATMPPIPNVALRDTLASLGKMKSLYDTRFAAHVVPCDIDYQLSQPIDPHLMGMDYIEAWLAQLLRETRWIAQFRAESCIAVLERTCPDYRGLHVNLFDLLLPHENEL